MILEAESELSGLYQGLKQRKGRGNDAHKGISGV